MIIYDSIRVIIADDNIFLAEALAENLNNTNDIVVNETFNNLDTLVKNLPNCIVDILILDINFNGVSALDYVQKIKAAKPKIKIIALTTLNNEFIKQDALKKGIDYFKGKDSTFEGFDNFVRKCHNENLNKRKQKSNSYTINGIKFTNTKVKVLRALYEYAEKTEDEIAEKLNISTSSLKTHKKQLYNITGTTKILDLIKFGLNNGIIIH